MNDVKDVYNFVPRYNNAKEKFLKLKSLKVLKKDIKLNPINVKYANDWLKEKETKLKRVNGYDEKAEIRCSKTLYKEITLLKNTLYWFNDIDLKKVTSDKIVKVWEDIEKGKLTTISGRVIKGLALKDYYSKVFRGDNSFFGFLNVNDIAKEVLIRQFQYEEDVRFFDFKTFKIIVDNAKLNTHKLAYWLLFDTGIEISALVQLKKSDFTEQLDTDTKGIYYKLRVKKSISKKSRQKRYLDILQPTTNQLLEVYLKSLNDDDYLFNFNPPALLKSLKLIVRKHKLKTKGDTSKEINIKDFRSSCATYLLGLTYSTDFIKARLGHKFSSRTIDRYVSYLGLNQEKPRREIHDLNFKQLENKYTEIYNIVQSQKEKIDGLEKSQFLMLLQLEEIFGVSFTDEETERLKDKFGYYNQELTQIDTSKPLKRVKVWKELTPEQQDILDKYDKKHKSKTS